MLSSAGGGGLDGLRLQSRRRGSHNLISLGTHTSLEHAAPTIISSSSSDCHGLGTSFSRTSPPNRPTAEASASQRLATMGDNRTPEGRPYRMAAVVISPATTAAAAEAANGPQLRLGRTSARKGTRVAANRLSSNPSGSGSKGLDARLTGISE